MTTQTSAPKINTLPTPKVGDAATYSIGSDSYPAVVSWVSGSGKTVIVKLVRGIPVDPKPIGYGHEATQTILDPESVENALSGDPKDGHKFMKREVVQRVRNGNEEREVGLPVGTPVTREIWSAGQRSGRLSLGVAISKMDPSF